MESCWLSTNMVDGHAVKSLIEGVVPAPHSITPHLGRVGFWCSVGGVTQAAHMAMVCGWAVWREFVMDDNRSFEDVVPIGTMFAIPDPRRCIERAHDLPRPNARQPPLTLDV